MSSRRLFAPQATPSAPERRGPLEASFQALRVELGLDGDYPPDAVAEAEKSAASVELPGPDRTDVPLFTIDPPGSTDLDQAMFLERSGDGYRVLYAIADVAAFVTPGGALDACTRERGQTMYFPDLRVPLHPEVLSEGAASLLPDQTRPAYLWELTLDTTGELTNTAVARATVRSTQRYDYEQVQSLVDEGRAPESLALLREIGEKRIALERARGGASLPMPEQEVSLVDGRYQVRFRPPLPAEEWNAQISLLTGMAAANLMLEAKVGILRTMPKADDEALEQFRRQAAALGVLWPADQSYGELLRTLDREDPKHLALIYEAAGLFRGAGYTPFDGQTPEHTEQAAVAAPYAHVTAPLRRLVDRFGLAVCAAVSAGETVPQWARDALPELPERMSSTGQIAGQVDRGSADAVEAALLSDQIGSTHPAAVVDQRKKDGYVVQLKDLPIVENATGTAELGSEVEVEVLSADIAARSVELRIV